MRLDRISAQANRGSASGHSRIPFVQQYLLLVRVESIDPITDAGLDAR